MAYMKKPSKKMYGGKKKKMYQMGGDPAAPKGTVARAPKRKTKAKPKKMGSFLEPGKEIMFGGPMKKQAGGTTSGTRGVGS